MGSAPRKPKLGRSLVSAELHALVKGVESGAMAVEAATYNAQREAKYAELSATRTSLYAYVGDLERRLGISQTVQLRF